MDEEMGMSDLQFKSHLKALVEELEEVKAKGVSPEAAEKLERMIARLKSDIES